MKTARVNNVVLSYRDSGSGNPLVFLHAFPLNQSMWNDQVAEFSKTFRVITLDWRGFGGSSLSEEPSTMAIYADDLAGLLDHLEIDRATICGLSMGGYAAFSFLGKYPDRIEALVLADTRATSDSEATRENRRLMAVLAREKGPAAIADQIVSKLLGSKTMANNPAIVARVRTMIEGNGAEGIARALLGMAERPDSTPLLAGIRCQTLIVVGEDDSLTPPSEAELMAKSVAGAQLAIIPGVGHLPNLELPQEFNRVVRAFLSSS